MYFDFVALRSVRTGLSFTHLPGISLLECSIVLALIACIALLGVSQSAFLYRSQVQAEIDALYAVARYLQQRAVATNTKQHLFFDVPAHSYRFNGTIHKLPSMVCFGGIEGMLGPPSAPSKPITRICSFADNEITFWPDGIIKAGTIYLVDKKKWYAYALSSAIGTVSCLRTYHYKQGMWFCRS